MPKFVRDRFTWLAYFMLGYYAYLQAILGPLIPFLRSELNLNYTVAGYHLSGFALGMTIAGFLTDRLVRWWGRYGVFWFGGAGMAIGAVLLSLGNIIFVTISAAFLMGLVGTGLLVMIQATLADRHGDKRAVALTEANILASATAAAAPALVGLTERVGLGWRSALIFGALTWLAMFVLYRRESVPTSIKQKADTGQSGKLPPVFWAYWALILFLVSVEWCVIFWGADFLEQVVKLPKVDAATAIGAYFLANVAGRSLSSRLARSFSTEALLTLAILVAAVGFPIFWLAQTPILNIIGLFITGLGVGSLFPLALSAASRVGAANSNTASSRISMAAGLAILITPQFLATIADQIGIQRAYVIVAVLLVIVLLVNFIAGRVARNEAAQAVT
jgi:MFS family permease